MAARKTKKTMTTNSSDYANTFKPAKVFNMPSTAEMLNRVFVKKNQETYDEQGNQLFYSNLGHLGTTDNPDAKDIYTLLIDQPTITPHIRPVVVKGKEDYQNNSYVLEPQLGAKGIMVLMMKKMDATSQIFCNVRFLPFTELKDIITDTDGPLLTISLPLTEIVKLNITLMSSSMGELLFCTHKTDIALEVLSEAQVVQLKNQLEFDAAQYVAHFSSLVLSFEAPENESAMALEIDFQLSDQTKQYLLGAGLICSIVGVTVNAFTPIVGVPVIIIGHLLNAIVALDNLNPPPAAAEALRPLPPPPSSVDERAALLQNPQRRRNYGTF